MIGDPCTMQDCSLPIVARGYCEKHYRRLLRNGSPHKLRRYADPKEALQNRRSKKGECILWTGHINAHGYGVINVQGKISLVHRYAWELETGQQLGEKILDHTCFERSCFNIEHLRIVDRSENAQHRQGPNRNTVSGMRNVYPNWNRWKVTVTKEGVVHYFGTFDTRDEACEIAETAREQLFGKFAGPAHSGRTDTHAS